jgi:hypothetical protein
VYDIAKELAGADARKQAGIKALAYAKARRAEIVLEEERRFAAETARLDRQRLAIESSLGPMPPLPTYADSAPAAVPVATTSQESDSEIIAILGHQEEEEDDGDDGCGATPAQDDSEAQALITLARTRAGDTQMV